MKKKGDRYALPRIDLFRATNVGELLRCQDKLAVMRLLGCEKKYLDGSCSDYEFFAEWDRLAPLCTGTGVFAVYREEKRLLGIEEGGTLHDRWRAGNRQVEIMKSEELGKEETFMVSINEAVSNIINECGENLPDYRTASSLICEKLTVEKDNIMSVSVFLDSNEYNRPDPYHASKIWENCDAEKWNECDRVILLGQFLIDGLIALKKCNKKVVLHLHAAEPVVADALLSYLLSRSLIEGTVRLGISTFTDPASLSARMEPFAGWGVSPELVLRVADLDEGLEERLYALFSAYPVGGVRFGGILTDSPLTDAYHISFDQRFRATLARLGADSAAIGQITERFYS